MKNKELIEKLQKLDLELEVQSEGCDCFGDIIDAQEINLEDLGYEAEKIIMLRRTNGCLEDEYLSKG